MNEGNGKGGRWEGKGEDWPQDGGLDPPMNKNMNKTSAAAAAAARGDPVRAGNSTVTRGRRTKQQQQQQQTANLWQAELTFIHNC